jgi:transcriptional regulator with XRE-family HTH domain
MKRSQLVEPTPLAGFVRERLSELGMRQADFCRFTGFDQGLLSKIQSSVISNISLESALRLAEGLCVHPLKILMLIHRLDLHELIVRSYCEDVAEYPDADSGPPPAPVLEINRLARRAYLTGRSLTPVIQILYSMTVSPACLAGKAKTGAAN